MLLSSYRILLVLVEISIQSINIYIYQSYPMYYHEVIFLQHEGPPYNFFPVSLSNSMNHLGG